MSTCRAQTRMGGSCTKTADLSPRRKGARQVATIRRNRDGCGWQFEEPDIHENTRSTNGSHHFAANATAVKWNEPMRSAPPQPNAGCKHRCRTVSLNTKTKTQKSNAK